MARDPHLDAQHIHGLLNAGAFKEAHRAAAAALKAFPREGYFANLLGLAKVNSGNPREAVFAFQKALKLRPGDADFQHNLINALISSGQEKKALGIAERLLKTRPGDARLIHARAAALFQAGRLEEAAMRIGERLRDAPSDSVALVLKGRTLMALGQAEAALKAFGAAAKADPKAFDIRLMLARAYERLGRFKDGAAALEAALTLRPDAPQAVDLLARFTAADGFPDKALALLEDALARFPEQEDLLLNRAALLEQAGRKPEACAAYRRLAHQQPGDPRALVGLVRMQSREENADLREEIEKTLGGGGLKGAGYCGLALALAGIHDAEGDYTKAAAWMEKGNRAFARERPFDAGEHEADFARITGLFTGDLPDSAVSPPSILPRSVFVIGLPRSGTTLCERVLSAAEGVYPGGELAAGWIAADASLRPGAQLDAGLLAGFADTYRRALPSAAADAAAITDKLPDNYRHAGLLALAFPDAAIVNLTRDPRDVALSQWRETFANPGMGYAYNLATLAGEANRYQRYMKFWHGRFPGRILDVAYEDLVRDIEGTSRRMAAHCGLGWTQAMTRPQDNTAPIRTASANQARAGVTTGSVGKWRRYAAMLAPFTGALDPELWPDLEVEG